MIFGIGVDVCEIQRMEKCLASPSFCKRVFGGEEWSVLEKLPPHKQRESAAANFAAKEAFLKAVGRGLGGFPVREIQALRRESGEPYYALSGKAKEFVEQNNLAVHLSLSHDGGLAAAFAVAEREA